MNNSDYENLLQQLRKDLVPIGSIFAFPAKKVPDGYLPCEGQELSIQLYPELYELIGHTWGGGKSSFCIPDLQGQFIRGWDREGDIDPEREFGRQQEDAFQGHNHVFKVDSTTTVGAGSHQHEMYREEHGGGLGTIFYSVNHDGYANTESCKKGKINIPSSGFHRHDLPQMNVLDAANSTFGKIRVSSETRPTNVALIFCIKVK